MNRRSALDLIAGIVLAIAIAAAVLVPKWRQRPNAAPPRPPAPRDGHAALAAPVIPSLPPVSDKHPSPFTDEMTARAESLCVAEATEAISTPLEEPVVVQVTGRYATGMNSVISDPRDGPQFPTAEGLGEYLFVDGVARSAMGPLSAWRCTMRNLRTGVGAPYVIHREAT
jgi:hypothetical protein